MREFNVSTVNDVIDARKRKFLAKYSVSENLCQVFARVGNLLYFYRYYCVYCVYACVCVYDCLSAVDE